MKSFIFLFFVFITLSCSTKMSEQDDQINSAISKLSQTIVKIDCPELSNKLPEFSLFFKDPIELFKENLSNSNNFNSKDSILNKWNEVFCKNADNIHEMSKYKDGALLIGEKDGTYWIATKAIIINGKLFVWSKKVDLSIGTTVQVNFDCNNKLNL